MRKISAAVLMNPNYSRENEAMLDLSSLVKRVFKTAEAKPAIAAVLVHKSVDLTKLQPMFEKHGLVFTQKGAEGDVLTFTQPDVVANGREGVLKFDDHVAFVVTGLQDVRVRQPVRGWVVSACQLARPRLVPRRTS